MSSNAASTRVFILETEKASHLVPHDLSGTIDEILLIKAGIESNPGLQYTPAQPVIEK